MMDNERVRTVILESQYPMHVTAPQFQTFVYGDNCIVFVVHLLHTTEIMKIVKEISKCASYKYEIKKAYCFAVWAHVTLILVIKLLGVVHAIYSAHEGTCNVKNFWLIAIASYFGMIMSW